MQRHGAAAWFGRLAVGVGLLMLAGGAWAQGRGAVAADRGADRGVAGARTPLVIRKLIGVGRLTQVGTPEFQTKTRHERPGYSVGGTRGALWAQIQVIYDTVPEWIDDITFNYYVLTLTKDAKGQRQYGFHRRTVRYIDVGAGRGHESSVFLHPTVLARYGDPVAAHVDVLIAGEVVAFADDLEPDMKGQLPEKWWENKQVLESEKTKLLDGYLKNRDETPFALINIDSQEVIR